MKYQAYPAGLTVLRLDPGEEIVEQPHPPGARQEDIQLAQRQPHSARPTT